MQTYLLSKLSKQKVEKLTERAGCNQDYALEVAESIFKSVEKNGDKTLFELTKKFDKADLKKLEVNKKEFEIAEKEVSTKVKTAIKKAKRNIEKFHKAQLKKEEIIEIIKGLKCWRIIKPIEKVGLYVPGGTAPLPSTVLMLGVPAQLAGCKEIILCTPPNSEGKIASEILFVAKILGIKKVYKVGGAQAVAAMALGTKSIPKVDKIFGPGNSFVTAAKILTGIYAPGVAIDMPAGPSEVLVIADETAKASFVAADLLSQAEHGADSQAVLVTTSDKFAKKVLQELKIQTEKLGRKDLIQKSLEKSFILVVKNILEAVNFSNLYAPEHLILSIKNPKSVLGKIQNAGSIFLGNYTPESFGDYASGTNHVSPTYGFAKSYSGVSVDSFVKKITCQVADKKGFEGLASAVEILAEVETLEAHKNAVAIRRSDLLSRVRQ